MKQMGSVSQMLNFWYEDVDHIIVTLFLLLLADSKDVLSFYVYLYINYRVYVQ